MSGVPSISAWRQSDNRRSLVLFLAVYLLLAISTVLNVGQRLENASLDLFYRLEPASPKSGDLLIVGIDELSFKELKMSWPWPRRVHADLIDRLHSMGARFIVFDVLFSEATHSWDDEILAESIRRAGNVFLGKSIEIVNDPRFARRMLLEPLQPFRSAARALGLMMITPDSDGIVRHFRSRIGGHETLTTAVAQNFSPPLKIPSDLYGLIHYLGPSRSIDIVSYCEVLDRNNPLPDERVRGRVVLVGRMLEASATPQSQADSFFTPFTSSSGQLMSGVEVHGNILRTLMTGKWGYELPIHWKLSFGFLLILTAAVLMSRMRVFAALGLLACLTLGTFLASLFLFRQWRLWLPPVMPGISLAVMYVGSISWKYLLEYREKRWLRNAFGRYVSHSLVETIIAHPERLELGGEETEVTVLFADLAGFTSLAEGMSPKALLSLLNEYFSAMTAIILSHSGTLDKFIGDAIMGVWGAPVTMNDHSFRACKGALEMQALMPQLQASWRRRGLPSLSARVGLHSGRVLAGNVGSAERFSYTVMGDTVNVASRLEGLNKFYGTQILLSDSTYEKIAGRFMVREIDQVRVKGRQQPLTIYELLGPCSLESNLPWLTAFRAGRNAYKASDWSGAERHFQDVLRLKPDDRATQVIMSRCRQYREQPPPNDWQGVFVLTEK
ncbi:MAG: CHASE2 domain-containing protein [Syntrophobacteraceae bacterium]